MSTKVPRKFSVQFCAIQYNSNIMKTSWILKNITNFSEAMKKDGEFYSLQMKQFGVRHKVLSKVAVGALEEEGSKLIELFGCILL